MDICMFGAWRDVGTVTALDPKITGTSDPVKLAIMVRVLSMRPERNTSAQSAQLAAAKRLIGEKI